MNEGRDGLRRSAGIRGLRSSCASNWRVRPGSAADAYKLRNQTDLELGYSISFTLRRDSGDSIEDYLERHPKVMHHRRVHCYRYGSGSIYLRPVGSVARVVINAHICRQCGTKLYTAVTRID